MIKRTTLLLSICIALGIHTPCYGLYVMVRSGFGTLKGDPISFEYEDPDFPDPGVIQYNLYDYTDNAFIYKDHKNLSVALGGRLDVFDIGALGLEVEILGAYANLDANRGKSDWGGDDRNAIWQNIPDPDFFVEIYRKVLPYNHNHYYVSMRLLYLKNQRIAGTQVNVYWEQYLLDWLSAGIGCGLGGAYVCTKFTTLEWGEIVNDRDDWQGNTELSSRRKYVHSGSLLYNFSLFVRAEKFETLFEVGYRHIGLHQMWNKCYGYTIPKLANMHSDQVYIGVGRTF
ncbi:MAG: hypothetical protein MJ218_00650 [Opitutales bacterium]|nr:hypothetical protein [Opitutales bacterium]